MTDLFSDYKIVAMTLAAFLSVYNYGRYLIDIQKGRFKPHMFSWLIWTFLSTIGFAAQWVENAGIGMYMTAIMGIGTLLIAVAAYIKGDRDYTKSDWISLIFALCAVPLWIATNDPLSAVILITLIDFVGLWPTLRKSWEDPFQESPGLFFIGGLICALGVAALSVFNLTTTLYPAALIFINWGFVVMLYGRRAYLRKSPLVLAHKD